MIDLSTRDRTLIVRLLTVFVRFKLVSYKNVWQLVDVLELYWVERKL